MKKVMSCLLVFTRQSTNLELLGNNPPILLSLSQHLTSESTLVLPCECKEQTAEILYVDVLVDTLNLPINEKRPSLVVPFCFLH